MQSTDKVFISWIAGLEIVIPGGIVAFVPDFKSCGSAVKNDYNVDKKPPEKAPGWNNIAMIYLIMINCFVSRFENATSHFSC